MSNEPIKQGGLAIQLTEGGQTPAPEPEPEPIPVEPQEPAEPLEPTEPPEPETIDDDGEIIPQVKDPDFKSWMGRKIKSAKDEVANELRGEFHQVLTQMLPQIQQQQAPQQPIAPAQPGININPEELDFINDPVGSFQKLFNPHAETFATSFIPKYNQQLTQQQIQKATQVLKGIEFLAKNDPNTKGDSDRIIEVAKTMPTPNFDTIDVNTATRLIFTEAQNKVLTEKISKKVNPLEKNKPATQPIGSIKPNTPTKPAAAKPNVSAEVMREAAKMGLSEEDAYKLLQE